MNLTSGKSIEITDKPLFDEYFRKYSPEISEFTFTNLFIWRKYYNFSFMEWENHLFVFSHDIFKKNKKQAISKNKETIFFMPPVGPDPLQMILELCKEFKFVEIHRVPASLIGEDTISKNFASLNIQWVDDRNNWDYVYEKEKLVALSGRKLYRKRRWLKRFNENYTNHKFHLLSGEWLETCKELQIEWCDMNECRMHEDLIEEQTAVDEAFEHYSDLKYRGGLLMIDEKCVAYTLGDILNPSTGVIHIEKALVQYEGAYQAINQHFIRFCCEEVSYINREQDLGDPGLRQAKETYMPHHMVEKGVIYRKPF